MYSYEERIRAVKRYIKHSKRTGPTIRQLGYPTKNSLKGWSRKYEQNRDLQVVYTRSSVKYTAEQIQVAIQHYLDQDQCIASTLKVLGGGSNRSLQHLQLGGVYGATRRMDEAIDREGRDALSWSSLA